MNSDTAIKITSLTKSFSIGKQKEDSFRSTLASIFSRGKSSIESFLALDDVSFEVKKGEIVGIVGKNGAGKSTLLKIISQISKPTKGKIEINGRVASLLEVGTGFHPELTGRENIYLNGTILGMTRKEIKTKLNEIIEFSGVEKFIDTPVKKYSSGMYVRLAFAVAAHLESEILIIDEVLAVGDAEFQKKCMGKMEDISSKSGRTIFFVSHNMTAISSLCTNAILLRNGKLHKSGTAQEIINEYLANDMSSTNFVEWTNESAPGDEEAKLLSARLVDENLQVLISPEISKKIGVEIRYEVLKGNGPKIPNIHLYTTKNEHVFYSADKEDEKLVKEGIYKAIVWIPANLLNVEAYSVAVALSTISPLKVHFWVRDALIFETVENLSNRTDNSNLTIPGIVRPLLDWDTSLV